MIDDKHLDELHLKIVHAHVETVNTKRTGSTNITAVLFNKVTTIRINGRKIFQNVTVLGKDAPRARDIK